MRVLILTQYFSPESFAINAFARALRASGAVVTVLTGQPNYPDGVVFPGYRAASIGRERFDEGIEVFRVPIVPRGRAGAARLAANYLSFVVSASVIGPWLLRRQSFDIVFVYAPSPIVQAIPGMVLRRVKRAKLVTWVQDLWPQSLESTGFVRNRLLLAIAAAAVRWIYHRNDLLLGQSRTFVAAIRPIAGGTPVDYFPNPGEVVPDAQPSASVLMLTPGFNVVFAGNLGTVQSLETILDAADLLRDQPDIRFVVVGSGSRAGWLAAEVVRRRLLNVQLPGRFERDAMPGILAQADALLVTLNRGGILGQTIPSKVQSYFAAGRPVLAALDGEGASLVREAGAGLASPAEDSAALARNVLALRDLPVAERQRMGSAGRAYFNLHFHPDVLAHRLLGIFRSLAAAAPVSSSHASVR